MNLGSTFGRFFNDTDLDQIEGFISGILSTPDIPKENDNERVSSDFLNNIFEKDSDKKELDQLFGQFSVPVERLLRYSAYDEVYRSVAMIRRIVKVYKANIIQKNPVNNLWYLLRKTEYTKDNNLENEQNADLAKDYYEGVLESFKIQYYLKNLYLHQQLMYGDCFIEVLDLKKEKEKVDLKKISVLNEISNLSKEVNKFNRNTPELIVNEAIESVAEALYTISDGADEQEEDVSVKEKIKETRFKNILLRVHKPHNIIILETRYGTKLGYLEVSKDALGATNNLTQTLSSITNRISSVSADRDQNNSLTSKDAIVNKIVGHILKKVTSKQVKFKDSVIDNFKRFIIEQNIQNQQVNLKSVEVRFIPVSRVINFSFPSSENFPYGGSIIEPLLLPGKLFILSQLSNIYMKLSRAPLTRKWVIDQGSVQMSGQLIQRLKREIRNNRVAVEDMSSFKNISKIMSDYKDFFILQKNGQRALDVEVQSLGDSSIKVADLEDARRELVALSGVPAPLTYSGLQEKSCLNNYVNSGNLLTGNAEDNPEPSLEIGRCNDYPEREYTTSDWWWKYITTNLFLNFINWVMI